MATLEELHARGYAIPLFWILMRPTDKYDLATDEGKELMRQHLQWQFDLEQQGVLLGAGPLSPGPEPAAGGPLLDAGGVSIVAATSLQAAEAIAATEPFRKAGWRETQVASWLYNEGCASAIARELVGRARV